MVKKKKKKNSITTVWLVSREYEGLAGAGGVKDVCRQLAEALANQGGCGVRVIIPRYGFIDPKTHGFKPLLIADNGPAKQEIAFEVDLDYTEQPRRERVTIWHKLENGVTIYLVEAARYAEKQGVYAYTAEEEARQSWQKQGMGHYDYFAMNILLQKAALALMIILGDPPDVIHCQDGHAAVLPAMMREIEGYRHYFRNTGAVVTIHNAGIGYHQEVSDLEFAAAVTGLPPRVIAANLLEETFDPFLAASRYALLTTVSENYARELQETDEDSRTGWLGHELLKRSVQIIGITNGINPDDFDSRKPKQLGLVAGFDPGGRDHSGKLINKSDLLRLLENGGEQLQGSRYGSLTENTSQPLLTFIGRLTAQKGVDILEQSLEKLLVRDGDFQFVMLGSGEKGYEAQFIKLAEDDRFRGRFCFLRTYSPALANKIYAAGDFFLIPSQYEPCGLTDYIAQLLGNLPIVHQVGGLTKVIDGETGFAYQDHSAEALVATVEKALAYYRSSPEVILAMRRAAVVRIKSYHTWDKVMTDYLDLYGRAKSMAVGKAT